MSPSGALDLLGLDHGADIGTIRKAYALQLKAIDVDADPDHYARLRTARDVALRSAKAMAVPQDDERPVPSAAEPAPEQHGLPWTYAAPTLPELAPVAGNGTVSTGTTPADAPAASPPSTVGALEVELVLPLGPAVDAVFAGPPLIGNEAGQSEVGLLSHPDVTLASMLYPQEGEEEQTLSPLTDEQEALAQRCLARILADAAQATLTVHGRIEEWLADLLASTWPRSAPFLDASAAAFGWEHQRGQLRESRAIAWLNARLRGLRYQAEVAQPSHPLNEAWVELRRPGAAKWFDRRRVSGAQVSELLNEVRTHFPELEHHMDPQRVGSWEQALARSAGMDGKAWMVWAAIVGIVLLISVFGEGDNKPLDRPDRTPTQLFSNEPADSAPYQPPAVKTPKEQIANAAVTAAFGAGKTMAWLRAHQPDLAKNVNMFVIAAESASDEEDTAIASVTQYIRRAVYYDAKDKGGKLLMEMMRIRLGQLDAARGQGTAACNAFLRNVTLDGVVLPPDLRAREQALAASMAESGKLSPPKRSGHATSQVPGEITAQVIDETGYSKARVLKAMQQEGTDAELCAVTRAVLNATLKWKGPERGKILMVL